MELKIDKGTVGRFENKKNVIDNSQEAAIGRSKSSLDAIWDTIIKVITYIENTIDTYQLYSVLYESPMK